MAFRLAPLSGIRNIPHRRESRLAIRAALIIFSLSGCAPPIEEKTSEGSPPIHKIYYRDSRIVVFPSVHWKELVNTNLFDGFRPGMTFEEAFKEVGPPDKTGKGLWGPYYLYRRPSGQVTVSYEEIGSGTAGTKYASWRLRALPDRGSPQDLLNPTLRRQLEGDFQQRTELVIINPEGDNPSIEIVFDENRSTTILWISE